MKRLAMFLDGTWKLSATTPTFGDFVLCLRQKV